MPTFPTTYFPAPGPENTGQAIELAVQRAGALNIPTLLVATTSGASGVAAIQRTSNLNLVIVSHSTGFVQPDTQELTEQNRLIIAGCSRARLLTGQHAFGGVGRAVRKKLGAYQLEEIMAYTLRIFGQGVKVAIEIALMAADAGLVRTDRPVISLAGSNTGLDTALVLRPSNAQTFFDLKVLQIICMPSE